MRRACTLCRTALDRLNQEFGIRDQRLASFMCGGVASFIMEDTDGSG